MLGLKPLQFLRATLAGFFATFVMTIAGYWQQGQGLPRVDAGDLLAQNARRSELWGSYAHYMIGIILALGYARWFEPRLPGPAALKGVLYGIMTSLLADGLVMPLIDPRVGPFFAKTPRPALLRTASLVVHLAYGLALGVFYAERERHVKDNSVMVRSRHPDAAEHSGARTNIVGRRSSDGANLVSPHRGW